MTMKFDQHDQDDLTDLITNLQAKHEARDLKGFLAVTGFILQGVTAALLTRTEELIEEPAEEWFTPERGAALLKAAGQLKEASVSLHDAAR